MRHSALLGALGAVAVAGTLARAAEPPPGDKAESPSWYARLAPGLTGGKKPDADKTFGATPARPPLAIAPLEPAVLAEALRAEQDAWDRRLEVCHRLRVVGNGANDEALLRQANDLEKQATALYHSRAARLGVKPPLRGKPEAAAAASDPVAATPARNFKVVTP